MSRHDAVRQRCVVCRTRYRQHTGRLCRQCWQAAGCPRTADLTPVRRVVRARSPIRPVQVEGLDGWVVWDGTCQVSIHEAVR